MKNLIILFSLLWAQMATAQSGPVVSLGVGTLGATLEAGYRLGPNFGLRGIAGYAGTDVRGDFNGAPLSGHATIGGFGLLADIYFGRGARLTTGAIAPNYRADLNASGDITINGTAFTDVDIAASLDSQNSLAPLITLGYDKTYASNWGISADIGAMYYGGFAVSASDISNQVSQADINAELAGINAELGQITVLPYVKLSVSFQF